jgi:hypothetical protein
MLSSLIVGAFVLNGSATLGETLRLTTGLHEAGSAFLVEPIRLGDPEAGTRASFSVHFQFVMRDNCGIGDDDGAGADGITFAIASEPTLGSDGGGLGIEGSDARSVAVELDTYANAGESGNHVGIDVNGVSEVRVDVLDRINDGATWSVWIDYDGNVLEVRLRRASSEKPKEVALAYRIDLVHVVGERAHLGFTGATGDGGAIQDIVRFER